MRTKRAETVTGDESRDNYRDRSRLRQGQEKSTETGMQTKRAETGTGDKPRDNYRNKRGLRQGQEKSMLALTMLTLTMTIITITRQIPLGTNLLG